MLESLTKIVFLETKLVLLNFELITAILRPLNSLYVENMSFAFFQGVICSGRNDFLFGGYFPCDP